MLSSSASIQWDAADVHYSAQKYFSDNLLAGKLPFWSSQIFSGMPFLADPQTGAWYPLNWPFFLAGITPRSIQWELALHCLLACVGVFLLTRDLVASRPAAILAGVLYGFSGFFASHSSHIGIFQTAAILPWLLWFFQRAVLSDWRIFGPATALTGGMMVLIGHFQAALYSFTGLALFTMVMLVAGEPAWRKRTPLLLAFTAVGAALISAILILPGLELTANSIRARADFARQTSAVLTPGALFTLLIPDFYGAVTGAYKGPGDITQFYFYQGLLAPFLAMAGLLYGKIRRVALALLIPALWYAFGPGGGLYLLIARLPGFRSVQSPVHIWFLIALGLALLASAGAVQAAQRWNRPWLIPALLVIAVADLWYWNSSQNLLAYARSSYGELYGSADEQFGRACAPIRQNPLHRIWYERDTNSFGPMNAALNTRTEVTFGYNPLELARYADYRAAAASNPRLLEGLAVTHRIDRTTGGIGVFSPTLSRVSVPRSVALVTSPGEARKRLAHLAPSEVALVESAISGGSQDPAARVEITAYAGDSYRIRYTAASPSWLRLSVPYFPGWSASVSGHPVPVAPLDLALTGILLPSGTNEVVVSYRPTWFLAGALTSALSALLIAAMLARSIAQARRCRPVRNPDVCSQA
ncbi:YfhO family protein [Paludibaculum fermentans]|uniref:YfhO family protein n=1 Tax=Paludibaculum fermentans TaxID=1473598 RepID=A0A7S7NS83_PALFE|nr:YfhO family protein [Paludibaculum fermentans]QOY88891.1 YfhO family protein [Paludibaculum fermentans]